MMYLLLLFSVIFATHSTIYATTTFHLQFQRSPLSANCEITQIKKHDDFRSFWTCSFTNNSKGSCNDNFEHSLSTKALSIGFNYDRRQAFTTYKFSAHSPLGKFLFERLGLFHIKDEHVLTVYYGNKPYIDDEYIMLTDRNEQFHFVSVNLSFCELSPKSI